MNWNTVLCVWSGILVEEVWLNSPADVGSLVLGQDQECYGGCFSPQRALSGEIADLRIWNRALGQVSEV